MNYIIIIIIIIIIITIIIIGFVIEYAWISKLLRDATFTCRPR